MTEKTEDEEKERTKRTRGVKGKNNSQQKRRMELFSSGVKRGKKNVGSEDIAFWER